MFNEPRNIQCKVDTKAKKLTIEVDLTNYKSAPPSSTNKTRLVASTGGPMRITDQTLVPGLSITMHVMVPMNS